MLALSLLFALGLSKVKPRVPKMLKEQTFSCVVCTTVVGMIEELLIDEVTEQEIESWMEKVCTLYGETYQTMCLTMCEYIPIIMKFLGQGLEIVDVCSRIGFCTDNKCIGLVEFREWVQSHHRDEQITAPSVWKLVNDETVEKSDAVSKICAKISVDNIQKVVASLNNWRETASDLCREFH